MNRKQMIDFINNEVLPGAEIAPDDWFYNGRHIVNDIVKAVGKWRIGKPANVEMHARIIDGVLYINGGAVARVAAKMPRVACGADHYEEKILSMHENEYD